MWIGTSSGADAINISGLLVIASDPRRISYKNPNFKAFCKLLEFCIFLSFFPFKIFNKNVSLHKLTLVSNFGLVFVQKKLSRLKILSSYILLQQQLVTTATVAATTRTIFETSSATFTTSTTSEVTTRARITSASTSTRKKNYDSKRIDFFNPKEKHTNLYPLNRRKLCTPLLFLLYWYQSHKKNFKKLIHFNNYIISF